MPILTLPLDPVVDAIHGSTTRVTQRARFFEFDGITPWSPEGDVDVPLVSYKVDVDLGRDERRTFDMTISGLDGTYVSGPTGVWYDKVVKIYRGIILPDGSSWERALGYFYIDTINENNFPNQLVMSGRDRSKSLRNSKFAYTTLFPVNYPIEDLVSDVAFSGGIPLAEMDLPITGESLGIAQYFDSGSERWAAIREVSLAHGYDVYFDEDGLLKMVAFQDPATLAAEYTFRIDATSNIASYSKKSTDARLRNHIVVQGENADQVPIIGEAENTTAASPTRIARVGRRTEIINSAFVKTQTQANELAANMLKVMGLEQFDLDMTAITVPYLDVGAIAAFDNGVTVDEYIIRSLSLSSQLGPMSVTAGRVINIIAS